MFFRIFFLFLTTKLFYFTVFPLRSFYFYIIDVFLNIYGLKKSILEIRLLLTLLLLFILNIVIYFDADFAVEDNNNNNNNKQICKK